MKPEEITRQEFLYLSHFEKVLFYVLVYASLAYMAYQIIGRARLWMSGKPVPWGIPGRIGWKAWVPTIPVATWWLKNFRTYVLAQKKVRSSRSNSGARMHLLIFYGFVTLFIGTTLLAIDKYGPIHFHYGTYFLGYEESLDWMGFAFLVGIVWAFFRRLKMSRQELGLAAVRSADESQKARQAIQGRRRPMTHTINDDLTLLLLFIVGATGFLLEAARMSVNPQPFDWSAPVGHMLSNALPGVTPDGYRAIWWVHMALIFVFFAVIPKMRLRHIVMAILSTAGRPNQPMGELRTISMEEVEQTGQIGVTVAKDYSRWHLMSLDACMECGRCTEVCPAWKVGKVLNPKQVVQDLRGAMVSGETVAAAVTEEALWACTTCNACVEACPVLIRHVDLIVDARRNLVAEGKLSGTGAVMLRQVGSTGNAWGAQASTREDWMKGLDVPLCRDSVDFEYLFWVGCAGATDPGAIKTTKAVAQLLTQAGVSFACLGQEEACTGDPARRIGDEFLFQEKAMQNASVFEKYKVKKVVTACPHCLNSLKNEYPQFEAKMEVFHHSQLLQELVEAGKLKAASPEKGSVVYHDPCYLARVNNESDAPRAVLGDKTTLNTMLVPEESEGNLTEAANFGRKTLCCGAGGGRMWMEEAPDQRPGNVRAEQLLATGAKTVALGCPFCRIMLDASIKQVSQEDIRLVDLAEMLQESNKP